MSSRADQTSTRRKRNFQLSLSLYSLGWAPGRRALVFRGPLRRSKQANGIPASASGDSGRGEIRWGWGRAAAGAWRSCAPSSSRRSASASATAAAPWSSGSACCSPSSATCPASSTPPTSSSPSTPTASAAAATTMTTTTSTSPDRPPTCARPSVAAAASLPCIDLCMAFG